MFLFTQRLDLQSIALIGKEEGIKGYWKGNLPQVCFYCPVHLPFPSLRNGEKKSLYFVKLFLCIFSLNLQVIRVIPYSAVQLFAYEAYKVIMKVKLSSNPKFKIKRIFPLQVISLGILHFSVPLFQKIFSGKDGELSIIGRLAAGACAGMTSTFVSYEIDRIN